jgi:hypothetical protein
MRFEKAAIIAGILLSSVLIFLLSQLIFSPGIVVKASSEINPNPDSQNREAHSETKDCSLSTTYPVSITQWCDWIEQYSAEYGVPANLTAAVMLQESGGNPQSYSTSGAVGLMQVMPSDGIAANFECANGPCFSGRPSMAELFDPRFNIEYGVHMIAALIRCEGNIREALKAYGPFNVVYSYADKVMNIVESYQ